MEDTVVCPICETENDPDATHCEVCGERLTPAEPGEEVGPEESVAESLSSDGGEVVGFAVEGDDGTAPSDETADFTPAAFEDDYYEFDPDELSSAEDDEVESVPAGQEIEEDTAAEMEALEQELAESTDERGEEPATGAEPAEAGETEAEDLAEFEDHEAAEFEEAPASEADFEQDEAADFEEDEAADFEQGAEFEDEFDEAEFEQEAADEAGVQDSVPSEAPDVLYSPLDGTAYHAGSPEYEEGFGPMGEELVPEPPELDEEAPEAPVSEAEEGEAPVSEAAEAPSHREPSPEFRAAFQAREKERPQMEPLPQPGTYTQPATLTVYVNREPVLRHEIETDETLIGRKDPVSDAYPDLDLTDLDPESHVSRKHAYIYRQNKNYTLYAVSNAGTQLNDELLDLGDRRPLSDDDVIVLAGKIAMKFDLPDE